MRYTLTLIVTLTCSFAAAQQQPETFNLFDPCRNAPKTEINKVGREMDETGISAMQCAYRKSYYIYFQGLQPTQEDIQILNVAKLDATQYNKDVEALKEFYPQDI